MRKPKIPVFLFLVMALDYFPVCMLTDAVGIQPVNSTAGDQVIERLRHAGERGYLLGIRLLADKENARIRYNRSTLIGAVNSGLISQAISGVQKDRFYSNASVQECEDQISVNAALWMSMVGNAANQGERSDYFNMSMWMGFAECNLLETGRILELGATRI